MADYVKDLSAVQWTRLGQGDGAWSVLAQ